MWALIIYSGESQVQTVNSCGINAYLEKVEYLSGILLLAAAAFFFTALPPVHCAFAAVQTDGHLTQVQSYRPQRATQQLARRGVTVLSLGPDSSRRSALEFGKPHSTSVRSTRAPQRVLHLFSDATHPQRRF